MLKVLRDNLKYLSWILWAVIAVFVGAIFVDFGRFTPGQQRPSDAAATVGNEKISFDQLNRQYKGLERQLQQAYGDRFNEQLAKQMHLELQAINQLVNQKVLVLEAKRLGLQVTDSELSEEILKLPAFQNAQGKFVGESLYAETLRRNGYSISDFEDQMRQDLLTQKLNAVLSHNLYIPDKVVEKAYRDQVEKAKIRFVDLPASRFEDQVKVSDDEIARYYDEHKDGFKLPEQRKVSLLLVDTNQLRSQISIDEGELHTYYDEHQDEFKRPEEVQARHILVKTEGRTDAEALAKIDQLKRKIEAGADFAAVAKESSEDPGSAARGGDLGFFPHGRMTPEFEKAAFAAKVGQLVGPIKTPFGYHLLEVTARRAAGVEPFPDARNQIRAKLAAERAPTQAEAEAKHLAEQIHDQGTGGDDALQKLATSEPAVSFSSPAPFGPQDPIPGIGRAKDVNDAVFSLEAGGTTEALQVPRGWVIARLDKIVPPHQQELPAVEDQIRRTLKQQKTLTMAQDRLTEAKKQMEAGKSLEDVAKELGVDARESNEFGAHSPIQGLGFNPEVSQEALSMKQGEIGGPVTNGQGAVLFQVTERTTWDPKKFETEKATTRQRLAQDDLNRLLQSLIEKRRDELGVTFNPQLVKNLQTPDVQT